MLWIDIMHTDVIYFYLDIPEDCFVDVLYVVEAEVEHLKVLETVEYVLGKNEFIN